MKKTLICTVGFEPAKFWDGAKDHFTNDPTEIYGEFSHQFLEKVEMPRAIKCAKECLVITDSGLSKMAALQIITVYTV